MYVYFIGSCADGWSELNGKCYKQEKLQLNWHQAYDHCALLRPGTHLAEVWSQEENDHITGLMTTSDAIIGLNDYMSEGSYIWAASRQPLAMTEYSNWRGHQPDDYLTYEECVRYIDNQWNDFYCHERGSNRKFCTFI